MYESFPFAYDGNYGSDAQQQQQQQQQYLQNSLSMAAARMDMQTNGVRLQIPQFMQTGAPLLAPGGGAEVLPIGVFSNNSAGSPWFANNGITTNFSPGYNQSFAKTFVYPNQQHKSPSIAPVPPDSSTSPFDFDFEHDPESETSPSALSLHINSGFINPQNRLTPIQANAIGARAGVTLGSSTLNAPSPLGLPVYSRSGFDLLSVLARVAARPVPKIALGPVDLSSSFVVVDVRRYDHPIIYCSPSFCRLTGYEEHEVIGKNCRFLQSPNGVQSKGEYRRFTSNEAVGYLRKNLVSDKECQTSIINYRKSGDAFINLVTVIPIKDGEIGSPQEDDRVIYHVGFQVDLTEQPNAILQKLKDGSYIANFLANNPVSIVSPVTSANAGNLGNGAVHPLMSRDRKTHSIPSPVVAREFKKLMEDPTFMSSFPISTIATAESQSIAAPLNNSDNSDLVSVGNHPLSLLLLEYAPDFIHVVSLKGTFLYVAPSVRRVLGYEPEELIGKSLSDVCHPADLIPLMRELKESSATGSTALGGSSSTSGEDSSRQYNLVKPRPVDLLFRAQTKSGQYVWVECRGRLHVEPGKGRKAIMLSGRAKEMSMLQWSAISSAGGVSHPRSVIKWLTEDGKTRPVEADVFTEFWGTISRKGSLLVVGKGVVDVLGWDESQLIGRQIWRYLVGEDARRKVSEELAHMGSAMGTRDATGTLPRKIYCKMTRQDGSPVDVELVLYPSAIDSYILHSAQTISPAPVIYQIKLHDASSPLSSSPGSESFATPTPIIMHPLTDNVFKDLEISRNSSWQYELQQLRFANERLKEEIKAIEGDMPSPALQKQQTPSSSPQGSHEHSTTATTSHHHINPTPETVASPVTLKSYDHHLHQGMPSLPFNSPHAMTNYPSSAQYNPHVQHVPQPQHVQPQAWSPSLSLAVSMPMSFVSPRVYDAPSSVPLKRSWDGSIRNGTRLML